MCPIQRKLCIFLGPSGVGKTKCAMNFELEHNWKILDQDNLYLDEILSREIDTILIVRNVNKIPKRYVNQITKWFCFKNSHLMMNGIPNTFHLKEGEYIIL